jgi:tetratricopeptide (TPR) repeat protein
MKATSVKRLGIFAASVGVIAGLGFGVRQFQVRRLARSIVEQAQEAEKQQDYRKAARLYGQRLEIAPDDYEVMLQYADLLAKSDRSPKGKAGAYDLYLGFLNRYPGREDARRHRVDLALQNKDYAQARQDINILLQAHPQDGDLHYWMGLCTENGEDPVIAADHFRDAIEFKSKYQIEAYQHWATLLRDRMKKPVEGKQKIDAMVAANPNESRAYLERGQYLYQLATTKGAEDAEALKLAKDSFRKALALAPDQPIASIQLARAEEVDAGHDAARTILEAALEKSPKSIDLYQALFETELRANRRDEAVSALELGIKAIPDHLGLRYTLALLRAMRGEAPKLALEIEELKNLGFLESETRMRYLTAYYNFLVNNFVKARRILVPLRAVVVRDPDLKARVNVLLAKCFAQSNEPGKQQEALELALSAKSDDLMAQLGLIELKARRGSLDSAIEDYRKLLPQYPRYVRLGLARALLLQNALRPAARRNWDEAETLIDAAQKDEPQSSEPIILSALLLEERGQPSAARDALETLRKRLPQDFAVWAAEVGLLLRQRLVDEAVTLVGEASAQLGDRVDVRLLRAQVALAKGGTRAIATLNELSQNVGNFSRNDRRRLLATIASDLRRLEDLPDAIRIWTRVSEQETNDIEPLRNLIELGFQASDKDSVEKNILKVQELDPVLGRYYQAVYQIWRAEKTTNPDERETLAKAADTLLKEIKANRQDWALIPLAQARLEELELSHLKPDDKVVAQKRDTLISLYNQALDLGEITSPILRRVVQLLLLTGRGNEALPLYTRYPLAAQLAGDLGRLATQAALEKRDFVKAEQLARNSVAANPNDFQERIFLVRILLASGKSDEAEAELRQAIDLNRTDTDRWTNLVNFLVMTKQPRKAEKAVRDAEAALPASDSAFALGLCSEFVGRGFEVSEPETAKKWFNAAKDWYEKAVLAPPKQADNLLMTRRLIEFLIRTKQIAEAEKRLDTMIGDTKGDSRVSLTAWAKRVYAYALVSAPTKERIQKALDLIEPAAQPRLVSETSDPDDLRALARILDIKGSPESRKRATEILRALVTRNLAELDDRFLLARLEEVGGDWESAREQYRELILRSERVRDIDSLNKRVMYLSQFVTSLLGHRKDDGGDNLSEARVIFEKLNQAQPDSLGTLLVAIEIDRAVNQNESAAERIRAWVNRPNPSARVLALLAGQAEQLGNPELAEELLRRASSIAPNDPQSKLGLARFLGRHQRTKEAIDLCESVWARPELRAALAGLVVEIVLAPNPSADSSQLKRVAGWLEQATASSGAAPSLVVALGNLREQESRYDDAITLYRRALEQDGKESVALNNLAWLLALKEGKTKEALPLIDRAIAARGPIPDFLDTRGVIYLLDGDTQHAMADLTTATNPTANATGSRLYHLALAYHKNNDNKKAKELLEAAKVKGLPVGLHPLEQPSYNRLVSDLAAGS